MEKLLRETLNTKSLFTKNFFEVKGREKGWYKEKFIQQNIAAFEEFVFEKESEEFLLNCSDKEKYLFENYRTLQHAFETFCKYEKVESFFIGKNFEFLQLIDELTKRSLEKNKELYEVKRIEILAYIMTNPKPCK